MSGTRQTNQRLLRAWAKTMPNLTEVETVMVEVFIEVLELEKESELKRHCEMERVANE
jgi:hypothetical protein